ncbi:TlpA disulfide reductase family protein [uncultured Polaribacter sp.]|uniref:TlpA family protein disulfide reductase n=1 Tax=uncultured Polaribacter sp. TaxID=174711 RepID=UPI0026273D96|nr:TlpA disulfide reductase family protein [uncultured Polaribacter sp.]
MKKILAFIFLISSFANAQNIVNATMSPTLKTDWVILYKIEGATQKFVQNSKIKIDTIFIDGKKQAVGNFSFTLPENTEIGAYRVSYKLQDAGFVDFIFNKENISFHFDPNNPNKSVVFSESKENIVYKNYTDAVTEAQQELNTIQVEFLKNPKSKLKSKYRSALKEVKKVQQKYQNLSNGMFVNSLIKASEKNNPSEIIAYTNAYMSNTKNTFFDNINFADKKLLNSPFLVDKITDYIFFMNQSDNKEMQTKLYKESIYTVLSKIKELTFKKQVIEYLVGQFELSKNIEVIDYLLQKYRGLPYNIKNNSFLSEKISLFATEVGRTAPDFSWREGNQPYRLSQLNGAENYILVFWSTTCSHCLREIPNLHAYIKGNRNVKVIAFSLENDKYGWESYKTNLYGWHNVLGLNKWENKIARTYNIHSTPSYFILDANKKIIAKPEGLKDVKLFFD